MKIGPALLLTFLLIRCSLAQSDSVRALRSIPTTSPKIDGILEEEWWPAPVGNDFTQRDPAEGAPSTEKTEVRVMHSPTALYVAFRCYDREPGKILSTLTKHDRMGDVDQATIYLDPYHDHRTGYYFTINPQNVQAEGVIYNDDWMDDTWDGYWEAATARDDSGWAAEIMIPFSTLRFQDNPAEQVWGMNAQRYIARHKEVAYWQPVTRDLGRRVSGFGHLEGLSGMNPGRGLEIRPYAVANFEEEGSQPLQSENDWENLGLDAKYRLAPNLTLDATYNPDFAQIEADDEVINLSDYPVYLEEKRPFFLEGASIFDTPVELFYSRRITDPQAGAKISGKIGSVRLMGIAARNQNQDEQTEDFGILRLKQDIFRRSDVGFLLTDKQGPGDYWARLWSVDARLRLSDPWTIELLGGQSFRPDYTTNNWAHRWAIEYQSDKYSGEIVQASMARDFDANDAGWIRYSDFQRLYGWFGYTMRPEKWGLRRVDNNINVFLESKYDLSHGVRELNWNGQVQTMNYMYFGGGLDHEDRYRRHYVDSGEPYEDYDNFGNYNLEFYRSLWWWIWYETDFSKPLAFGGNLSAGDYRKGYEHDIVATLQLRPRDNLEVRLQEVYFRITGDEEINDGQATDFFLGRLKLEWTLTTRLFTRLNAQYVYGDEIFLTNALLGYNFAPQSFFYLVYDDQRDELLGWDSIQNRIIKMKVSYFFQI